MSDKPQSVSAPLFALPDHRLITLAGRDALVFAQAQFMNDIDALPDGTWHWNGWLTPKGRVIALFALLRIDAQTLWMLLPDADPQPIVAALGRFVFRSKVEFGPPRDLAVSGSFEAPTRAAGARFAHLEDDVIELDMGSEAGPRRLLVGVAAVDDPVCVARWRDADLAVGLPRLDQAQSEQWTPQQLSLERLKAFSVKKGCYPGQEIVARTHFLGKTKRGLVRLAGSKPMRLGDSIEQDGVVAGAVDMASSNGHECLSVLPLERVDGPLLSDGKLLSVQPLLGGLAR